MSLNVKRVALLAVALLMSGLVVSAAFGGGTRAVVEAAYNKTLKTSIVVDGKGRTLYIFAYDTSGKATCAAADPECPKLWPAFATTGKPQAGPEIKASLLGTTKGAHGVTQVT